MRPSGSRIISSQLLAMVKPNRPVRAAETMVRTRPTWRNRTRMGSSEVAFMGRLHVETPRGGGATRRAHFGFWEPRGVHSLGGRPGHVPRSEGSQISGRLRNVQGWEELNRFAAGTL